MDSSGFEVLTIKIQQDNLCNVSFNDLDKKKEDTSKSFVAGVRINTEDLVAVFVGLQTSLN